LPEGGGCFSSVASKRRERIVEHRFNFAVTPTAVPDDWVAGESREISRARVILIGGQIPVSAAAIAFV
jgi:hypothetical protein